MDKALPQANYYAVLDVDPKATRIQVREAFLRIKSAYGAGSAALYSLVSDEDAREQLARAEEAYRVLNDDLARRDYDQKMGFGRAGGASGFDMGAERLVYLRERELAQSGLYGVSAQGNQHHHQDGDEPHDPNVVKTTRSTLPIIKLSGQKTTEGDVKSKYEAIIAAGDPADGDLFKRLREAAEVSEDELVERTKISIAYMRAIESNRFERLPQAVYVKGFLRSYFRYLNVPEAEKLVTAFSVRLMDWQANKKS